MKLLQRIEKALVRDAHNRHRGERKKIASEVGVSTSLITHKREHYGLPPKPDFQEVDVDIPQELLDLVVRLYQIRNPHIDRAIRLVNALEHGLANSLPIDARRRMGELYELLERLRKTLHAAKHDWKFLSREKCA